MTKIIRLPQVIERTGLSRSSIYDYINKGTFPKQVNISQRSVGWYESEIDDWLKNLRTQ